VTPCDTTAVQVTAAEAVVWLMYQEVVPPALTLPEVVKVRRSTCLLYDMLRLCLHHSLP
jgi:hypothetical protein